MSASIPQQGRIDTVIGLGANLGDGVAALVSATQALKRLGVVTAISRLYRTAPMGGPEQPFYFNAALRLQYDGAPLDLLASLLAIEQAHGRVRRERWGPRLLDLDMLWILGQALQLTGLEVPHPRLCERAFALAPLLDVAPGASDPTSGRSYAVALSALGAQNIEAIVDSRWSRAVV